MNRNLVASATSIDRPGSDAGHRASVELIENSEKASCGTAAPAC